LHRAVLKGEGKKERRAGRTVFTKAFEGKVKVRTVRAKEKKTEEEEDDDANNDSILGGKRKGGGVDKEENIEIEEINSLVPFLQLTVDIPQKPLFKDDSKGGLVIPQENLMDLMGKVRRRAGAKRQHNTYRKPFCSSLRSSHIPPTNIPNNLPLVTSLLAPRPQFDGSTVLDVVNRKGNREKKQYNIASLPPYLVLNLKRFTKTKFGIEKNPTIVTFPVEGMDFSPYFAKDASNKPDVDGMKVKDLKSLLKEMGKEVKGAVEKKELIRTVKEALDRRTKYDLVASIAHDTPTNVGKETASDPITEGTHRTHARHTASNQWFEIDGSKVESVMPQMVAVSEAVVLVFKKQA